LNLSEVLVTVIITAVLSSVCLVSAQEPLARQELENASRELWLGLERARKQAEQQGVPCSLELGPTGWQAPGAGNLASCDDAEVKLIEAGVNSKLQLSSNLAAPLIFTPNGLVLGGGTILLAHSGINLQRCLVISLPLGITRAGKYSKAGCIPDG